MATSNGPGRCALRRGRHSARNGIYFITFVTDQRIPWFQDFDLARLMSFSVNEQGSFSDAECLCWVVMPDHVHLLLKLNRASLQKLLNPLKSRTARLLNREIGRAGRFWAPGYHDHALRKEEDLKDAARYIVANPIRAGLVKKYGDYPFWNCVWM